MNKHNNNSVRVTTLTLLMTTLSGCSSGDSGPPTIGSDIGSFSATLSWTPPTQNDDESPLMNLAGYKIYSGPSEGQYTNEEFINNPGLSAYTVQNLTANSYYFVVTAINGTGAESDFSNVVEWTAQ